MQMTSLASRLSHDHPLGHLRPPLSCFAGRDPQMTTLFQVSETKTLRDVVPIVFCTRRVRCSHLSLR